jgi:arsenate reductase
MTDTIYYLASCVIRVKNYKIVAEKSANLKYHDIKARSITVEELEYMRSLSGSYEAYVQQKRILYKSMDLKNKTNDDYRKYILEHYTFISRPVSSNSSTKFILEHTTKHIASNESIENV